MRDIANEEHTLEIIRKAMPRGLTRAEIRRQRLPGSLSAIWQLMHDKKIIKANSGRYVLVTHYAIMPIATLQRMAKDADKNA